MLRLLVLALALVSAAAPALANVPAGAGEEPPCTVVRPGDTPTCPGHPQAQATVATPAPPAVDDHRDMRERTHSLLFPTGGTLAAGQWQISNYDFVWTRLGIGVSDRLELSASYVIPHIAIPGARIRITPRESALTATVGASYWLTSAERGPDSEIQDDRLQLGGTLAYQTRRFNLHATVTGSPSLGESDSHLGMLSAGGVLFLAGNLALAGEAMSISSDNAADDQFDGTALGAKLLGDHIDIDVGLMFFREEVVEAPLPILGLTVRN